MKEIYRSFEGKLTAENQFGYIISEGNGFWQIEHVSTWIDTPDTAYRITKTALSESDFGNLEKIGEIELSIDDGCYESDKMQVRYKGIWYSCPKIRKIQETSGDYNWKRHI